MNMPKSSPQQDYPRSEKAFLFLGGIFLVLLVVANLITAKLFVLFGVVLAAGIIPYPITFLATDLICEVYGQKRANYLVFVGFVLSLLVLVVLQLGLHAEPFSEFNIQSEYVAIFGQSSRAIIASMIAYLIAQLIDVRLFHFWKRLTKGKHLWLRNNASTMISQLVDSVLVISILFYGKVSDGQLVNMIIAGYLFKMAIAALDTPFFYFGTRHLKTWALEGGTPLKTKEFWSDLLVVSMALVNIALLIVAAVAFSDPAAGHSAAQNSLLLAAFAIVHHILCTIALAQPEKKKLVCVIMAVLALLLGIGHNLDWMYGVGVTDVCGIMLVLTASLFILEARSKPERA